MKGFTLVELMSVIILIALIGLISVPAINKTLTKQKAKSFTTSVKGMIDAVKTDAENDKFKFPRVYVYENEILSLTEVRGIANIKDLQVSGKISNGIGTIKYDEDGNMFVSVKSDKHCAYKAYITDLFFGDIKEDKCYIENTQVDLTQEVMEFEPEEEVYDDDDDYYPREPV